MFLFLLLQEQGGELLLDLEALLAFQFSGIETPVQGIDVKLQELVVVLLFGGDLPLEEFLSESNALGDLLLVETFVSGGRRSLLRLLFLTEPLLFFALFLFFFRGGFLCLAPLVLGRDHLLQFLAVQAFELCQGTLSNLLGFGDLCLESFDFIRPQLPKHIGAPVVSGPGVYDAVLDLFLSRFDNQVLLGDVLFEVFDRIGIDVFQTGTFGFEKPVYFFRVDLYGVAVFIDSADCPGVGIGEFFGDGFEPLMFVGIQFGFAAERFVLRNQRRDGAFQRGHPVELLVELVYEGFAGPDQFGDAFNQPGDPVDYGLYESLAVVEGEHQSLPCALQEFYRPFDRVQPLFLYAFEFSINILQAVAEFSHRAGSPQERVERRHAALVGQVECFGKVDTFGVEPLEAVD